MLKYLAAATALFLTLGVPLTSRAGLDLAPTGIRSTPYELIVIEADGCIYCDLFRRDVLPSYEKSEQGRQAPARFIDVNDTVAGQVELKSPISIVPTFIVAKDRKEIGRVPGYVGPENFYHAINYLMASAP